MPEFGAKDVKALRDETGAGMMDAKKALTETDGDYEAAKQFLREKGLAKAAGREDRANEEGSVALAADGGRAAIVSLKCETDFAAKNPAFLELVQVMADDVLAGKSTDDHAAAVEDLKLTIKENIEVGKVAVVESSDDTILDTYLHEQDGRGINAVVVEGRGVDAEQLHEIALHIAFAKPTALTRDEIDSGEVDRERASLLDITKAEGKPEQAWDKIVEGRLSAWFGEKVLLEQGLFGEKQKVKDSLDGGEIVRFEQAVTGS